MIEQPEATRESADDAKDTKELVRLWLDAIALAGREEETWRKRADDTIKIYRQHDEKRADGETLSNQGKRFNVLHANVETLCPALYNSTPIPDVRRRYNDSDPIAKQACDVLERSLAFSVDAYDFDDLMNQSVKDMELAGRGVDRVRYLPYLSDDELAYEEVQCEHVPWKHFRRGPARTWNDVPWIAFELFLTRDELVKLSPKHGHAVNLDASVQGADDKKGDPDKLPEVFKRAKVWEIWDKGRREVLFLAESFKDGPIRRESDPLGLMGFFPIPRPLYAVTTSDSLVPVVPYDLYHDQAEELERVTQRIMALTEALKARGVYDSRATEISKLADADDNELIPIDNVAVFADGLGLDKKIIYWPIETIVIALEKLYTARDQIKQTIYEITGIADILRGSTDPNETLGAQELKAQWGSLRIQRKQSEIARYARDLFRLKAELIATKFQPQTLQLMTGIQLAPEVISLLRDDATRGFRIDVESDSTIRADLTRKQQNMNLFLQGTGQFAAAMGPIIMAPQFQGLAPAVVEIYSAFARNFKLGKQAEDALDAVADQAKQMSQQPPQEDPAVQAEKVKAETEAKKMEMDAQFQREKHGMELQMMQAKLQFEEQKLAMQERKLMLDMQAHQQKMAMDAEAMQRDLAMQERQAAMQMQQSEREHAMAAEATEHKHAMGLEMMSEKAKLQKQQARQKASRPQ